ncbi:DUF6232 family protein [Calothrix sp. UHCC 0171]|uniref:DUF6232 family protein n=1 Tax=Calothrix sp. UHCC 0171 TaxID=3110245 RepID=UPI002B2189D8|nr:DUF6232 family protein [Calothrix sp. UHCC 0171]MEA5574414.1 DUF6232 family protein [Calothrix sp. UHCC 0171]
MTLSQFLPDDTNYPTDEINTTILKIRGKTLIYGNVIYQIHNIASIGLVDMTKTTVTPMPKLFVALPFIGISLCFIPSKIAKILGILVIFIGIYLIYKHNISKIKKTGKYGMTIYTNGGTRAIFRSRSEDFIKRVILVLYSVMNSDELKSINFNFETLDMSTDKSITIGTNIGSPVISGNVGGDVVSQV